MTGPQSSHRGCWTNEPESSWDLGEWKDGKEARLNRKRMKKAAELHRKDNLMTKVQRL